MTLDQQHGGGVSAPLPQADDTHPPARFEDQVPADTVLQDEVPRLATVPVMVMSPVQVRELPSRDAAARTVNVTSTLAVRVLAPDHRRKRATLYAFDQEIAFGPSQAAAVARWPKQVPLYLDTRDEVWVVAATANTDITLITEAWAQ